MYMIYARFSSAFLAVSVTCFGLATGNSSFLVNRGKYYHPFVSAAVAQTIETNSLNQTQQISQTNQASSSTSSSTLTAEVLKYKNYMQAGYQADKNRDYLTALQYFKTALAIRPDDSLAQKAVHNVTGYAFDASMKAGYQADRQRDYQAALKYFQQAKEIRPDSFYAQQAIRNVSSYLASNNKVKTVSVETVSTEQQSDSGINFGLMIAALLFAGSVAGGILFLLLKTNDGNTNLDSSDRSDTSLQDKKEEEVETVVAPTQTYSQVVKPSSEPETTLIANTGHTEVERDGQKTRLLTTESNGNHARAIEQPAVRESYFISSAPSQVSKLDIIPELIANLEQSDRALRRKTIWELAQRADSRAMKPLVELMIKVDSQERSLILEAMTQIASRTLKPMNKALSLSLEDDNSQVRQNAIRDLTRVYELMSQVTQRLSVAVEDSDEEVQQTAKWALKQLNQMPKVSWQNNNDL
ncbi:MAG: HEAT repeat domain-containing protein [Xenococcaceae cyanobacterium MO_188.B29]|nr:HEAT repeat domain-containing protein [Xenococcaceae cyanobacterium MO_188.B29]